MIFFWQFFISAYTLKYNDSTNADEKIKEFSTPIMNHIFKLLNIYHHIFLDKRPAFIPERHKTDIFANSKEIQLIQSRGYFGNDYFYLKLFKTIRIIYESFKVTIFSNDILSVFERSIHINLFILLDNNK